MREGDCDLMAKASYRSAHAILTGRAKKHVAYIPDSFGPMRHLWQFSAMPDHCVLFARKFAPDTAVDGAFFSSCGMLSLHHSCIEQAYHTPK